MSDGVFKINFLSDNETNSSKYIYHNKEKINQKIQNLAHPKDYPSSMKDGSLYQKFAIEYIKNILFNGKFNLSENMTFNFSNII